MGETVFGPRQRADRGGDMTGGACALPFQYEGKIANSEDRVPLTAVVAAFGKLGDAKYFGEANRRLLDGNGRAWNLHSFFYTPACVFAQVGVFTEVLAVANICLGKRQTLWCQSTAGNVMP